MKLKSNIDVLMYQHNLTCKQLGEQIGVERKTILSAKNNKSHITLENAVKIAKVLNVNVNELYEVVE